jgi:hypothetical protein
MDTGARQTLKRVIVTTCTVFLAVAVSVWIVPSLMNAESTSATSVSTTPQSDVTPEEVDRFVEDLLRRIGAVEVLSREDEEGVVKGIFQLPKGAQAPMIAQRMRRFAAESDLELYASPVDGLDLEIRVYAGATLRQQLLLIPDLPEPPKYKKSVRSLDRPLIALVITNVGDASADNILSTAVPITVAIRPYTPFALRSARIAAGAWHEVLAHVPREMTPQEAQRAIPLATGIWFDGTPVAPLGQHDVVVVPSDRISGARTPDNLRVLPAQHSDRRDAMATLSRARHIAARMGQSALVIDADDPDLESILKWATNAHKDGYRMVLASEAARASEIHGPNGSLSKR